MRRFMWMALALLLCGRPGLAEPTEGIQWQPWSQAAFDQAQREHKLVLLDVEAVWCHWCHVMDKETYGDPHVIAEMRKNFVALKVDQDSRPDISNRYEDYGWPATVVFNGKGAELIKFSGYIPPKRLLALLVATVKDPTPGPSVFREPEPHFPAQGSLAPEVRARAAKLYIDRYDTQLGGWSDIQKFMDWDSVEYAMLRARSGEADGLKPDQAAEMATKTLTAELQLLDPVWGGLYQYSDGGVWGNPHYEKLIQIQSNDLRIYSLGYRQFHDPKYLEAARQIGSYLHNFLRGPDGGFYVSQDADHVDGVHSTSYFALSDAARRAKGIPRVDKHQYARENGWAIQALVAWYEASGDQGGLDDAITAAKWVQDNRSLPGGGFRHGEKDVAGPYLGDSLAMLEGYLALYQATSDRTWLDHATETGHYIEKTFGQSGPGYRTAVAHEPNDRVAPETDENLRLARVTNLLFQSTGEETWKTMRTHAMRFAAAPEIAKQANAASVLLTDTYLQTEPTHITVMGPHDDPQATALYREALTYPSEYRRLDWIDAQHPPLRTDVEYPTLSKPAAFLCTASSCSRPCYDPDQLKALLARK